MYTEYSDLSTDQIQTSQQAVSISEVCEYPKVSGLASQVSYSSFVIVYQIHNNNIQILAEIKDTSDNNNLKLPGGSRELVDKSPAETAIRELLEETGNELKIEELNYITDYEFLFKNKDNSDELRRAAIFAVQAQPDIRIISCLGDDIAGHKWVTQEEFAASSRRKSYVYAIESFVKWYSSQK